MSRLELNNLNNHKSFMISCISCSAASHGFRRSTFILFFLFQAMTSCANPKLVPKKKFQNVLKSIGLPFETWSEIEVNKLPALETMSRYNYSADGTVGKPLKATPRKGAGRQTDMQTGRQADGRRRQVGQNKQAFSFWPTLRGSSCGERWGGEGRAGVEVEVGLASP